MFGSVTHILLITTLILLSTLIAFTLAQRSKLARLIEMLEVVSRSKPKEKEQCYEPRLVHEISKAAEGTRDIIISVDDRISSMQRRLDNIADGLHKLHKDGNEDSIPKFPREDQLEALPSQFRKSASSELQASSPMAVLPETESTPFVNLPIIEASDPTLRTTIPLLEEYRKLLVEPRKSEINRWADDNGGSSCAVNEDGTITPLPREAGGLLVIINDSSGRQLLLPGGRMVVDFATSFANMMSMRSATRDCFELMADGTGILCLVEPAVVIGDNGFWTLGTPGQLSGFTS